MPLPPKIDATVRARFDELIKQADEVVEGMERILREVPPPRVLIPEKFQQETAFYGLTTSTKNLIEMIMGTTQRGTQIIEDLRGLDSSLNNTRNIKGVLLGLKSDYESGFLDSLSEMIEANVASDYMGQAEELLAEGTAGQYDHVPAAVLTGAVLEDSLRRLCGRQHPPISTVKTNGDPKTLDPLITDLQKANVFTVAKADQLRSWTKIRNSAAHGRFTEFKRHEVESMIAGIKTFLADYL